MTSSYGWIEPFNIPKGTWVETQFGDMIKIEEHDPAIHKAYKCWDLCIDGRHGSYYLWNKIGDDTFHNVVKRGLRYKLIKECKDSKGQWRVVKP